MLFTTPLDYFEAFAIIISILCFKKLRGTVLIWFIPYLILDIAIEWGSLFGLFKIHGRNHWIYNLFSPLEFSFFFYLFYTFLQNRILKKAVLWIIPLYCIVAYFNIFFVQGFNHFHTYTFMLGSMIVVALSCCYFYQLLHTPTEMKLYKLPFFWISVGLFFFYLGQFAVMSIFSFAAYSKDKTFAEVFVSIVYNLNILLYSCLIIGFLCSRRPNISIS